MKEATTETLHLAFDGKLLTCTLIGDVEILFLLFFSRLLKQEFLLRSQEC